MTNIKKSLIVILFIVTGTLTTSFAYANCFKDDFYQSLDYGLYWYGTNGKCEKAIPNQLNRFYQKDKPTVIFIHGWQPSTVSSKRRSTFSANIYEGPNIDTALPWRVKGWNIGILYWDQFADEPELLDAEAKIWTANGNKAMRWLSSSNGYQSSNIKHSVTELLTTEIISNMSDFNGSELRLAGHSLGHQLALTISNSLFNSTLKYPALQPKRIALLDPYASNGKKRFLNNDWVGERARKIVKKLSLAGVAIETYTTSAVASTPFSGDINTKLLNQTAYAELLPWYFGPQKIAQKHEAAIWHYFWSFEFSEPNLFWSKKQGLSASTTNERVRSLMNSPKKLQQVYGIYTKTPADDTMILLRK